MEWTRVQRGWYEATDAGGIRWRIVQEGSQKWQPRRSIGLGYEEFGRPWESLADAKWYCERESAERIAQFPPEEPTIGQRMAAGGVSVREYVAAEREAEEITIEASDPRYRSRAIPNVRSDLFAACVEDAWSYLTNGEISIVPENDPYGYDRDLRELVEKMAGSIVEIAVHGAAEQFNAYGGSIPEGKLDRDEIARRVAQCLVICWYGGRVTVEQDL